MCFEDRPNIADYDMNDVVLRCIRKNATQIELTLVATGAQDQVYICGIPGTFASGDDLNNKEVHELFGVPTGTFVNTEPSTSVVPGKTAVYDVSEDMTVLQFLRNIYIKNKSEYFDPYKYQSHEYSRWFLQIRVYGQEFEFRGSARVYSRR